MIRRAAPSDRGALKALWMAAFGDSREATDFYFAHRHRDEWMLVEEEAGQVRGMLTALPLGLRSPLGDQEGRYFFALATEERFRGQGISSRLMLRAEEEAREAGCLAAVLVPATPGLFAFYGKRGYGPCFAYRRLSVRAGELPAPREGARLYRPGAGDMLALRDEAYADSRLYARWDEEALAFTQKAARVYGAALVAFELPGARGCAYGEWEGDSLIVKDLPLVGIDPLQALALIHPEIRAARYQVRLRADSPLGEPVPFGLIKAFRPLPLRGGAPCLSFAKD